MSKKYWNNKAISNEEAKDKLSKGYMLFVAPRALFKQACEYFGAASVVVKQSDTYGLCSVKNKDNNCKDYSSRDGR